ncbi:MAG: PilZ domain-containing protein [Deltaproteobacteria bacterium]
MDIVRKSDKRRHKRLGVTYQVSYRLKDSTHSYNMSRTKNISRGGMLLSVNTPYPAGTWLTLLVRLPFLMQPVEVAGEVLSSREMVKGSLYEVRIRFSSESQERLGGLDEFIKRRAD